MALTKVSYSMIQGTPVNVVDYGADPSGSLDSTTAIQAAEAAAYAAGTILFFPPGLYLQNGPRIFRCSINGYGATIKNTIGSEQTNVEASAVIRIDSTNDLQILGITVDGDEWSTGFFATSANRITYRDCVAKNCLNEGFGAYYCNDLIYDSCRASNIKYNATGLIDADGFFVGGCNDTAYINCTAENFQRIGFVSEGVSLTRSARTRYVSCLARNGNNCDRSPAQYNAGFWAEQTNGVFIDDCTVIDMAGNPGQGSGRVIGIVLAAVGDTTSFISVLSNTTIGDSSGTIPQGVQVSGTGTQGIVIINNVRIENYNIGITVLGGLDSVIIENVTILSGVYYANAHGGVVINLAASPYTEINKFSCINLREILANYIVSDAATINGFAPTAVASANQYYIDKLQGSLILRTPVKKLFLTDSVVDCRSITYPIANAFESYVSNTQFNNIASAGKVFGQANPAAKEQFVNCNFVGFPSGVATYAVSEMLFSNCIFTDSRFVWSTSNNNPTLKMENCVWKMSGATSCWYGNFYLVTKDTVILQNCSFYTTATYAVEQWLHTPTYLVLQGNTYNNANLTNMATTSSANNVAIP